MLPFQNMKSKNQIYLLAISILFLTNCKVQKEITPPRIDEGQVVLQWMKGSYNSSQQAAKDSSFYNISLHMYPIWEDKGNFLYVEQALDKAQDKPYRQRVYEVIDHNNGIIESKVYKLKNETDCIGQWKSTEYFNQFDRDILSEREGCSVYLKKQKDHYQGSTRDKDCASSLRGASYATSIVTLFKNRIESWDQGFDSENLQVWGATKSGYIFQKYSK